MEPVQLELARLAIDADEVESTLVAAGALEITVRHMFVAGWQTRFVLSNPATRPITLGVTWPWLVDPGAVGWAVADGAEAALFVQPHDGAGPILVGRLRQGAVVRFDEQGLALPEIVLDPGGRYVLGWDWDWLTEPSAYGRRWATLHPTVTTLVRGEVVLLPAGPDVALVVPDGIAVERDDELCALTAAEPRTAAVELRSARGLHVVRLTWTPTATELLAAVAGKLLAAPRGRTGVVRLPGLDAAVVVQHALRAEAVDAPDDAQDALDQFTARFEPDVLDPAGPDAAFGALFLAGEFERTGEPELLDRAAAQVLRATRPAPGLGVAATRVCAGLIVAGASPQAVMDHLIALAGRPAADAEPDDPLDRLALSVLTRHLHAADHQDDALVRAVLALGTELGSGLPGDPVRPWPAERLGRLLATFATLPDGVAEPTRRAWGVPAADLAARRTPTLIARLVGEPLGRGHRWLAVLASAGGPQ
ncbi:hypothetical protein GCM10022236_07710 [Microlunatus ginsengisoli]|uniref:Uncharacterized protein n=2 Tax=Microlunatus ginsengisoli TaxID=363863 RepID=A0ABP6ZJQ6_9ACTN